MSANEVQMYKLQVVPISIFRGVNAASGTLAEFLLVSMGIYGPSMLRL